MRSLQREVRDRFPPREVVRARIEPTDRGAAPVRRGLPIVAGLVALSLGALAAAVARTFDGRVVADARVDAFRQVLRAPADVRVLELRCTPGQRVCAGDVLAVLAPVRGEARVRAAEIAVERAQARLAVLAAGGRLEDLDLGVRVERTLEARRESAAAAAACAVRTAEVEALERERARVELVARLAREDRSASQDSFEARRAEASARVERAVGAGEQAALEVERLGRLAADGLVSELALAERRTALRGALRTRDELSAALDAVRLDQSAERTGLEHDQARDRAALDALDAALEAARRRLAEARARADEWSGLARERALLAPAGEGALAALHERELELARLDLESAWTELAAAHEAAGGGELQAGFDGRVESVAAVPGALLVAGDPLLVYHDTTTLGWTAYLRPTDARGVELGARCTLVPEDGGPSHSARVKAIAPRLVLRPPDLAPGADEPADLRVALHLASEDPALLAGAPLDLRFKVVIGGHDDRGGP